MTKLQASEFNVPYDLYEFIKVTPVQWEVFTEWFLFEQSRILQRWKTWFESRNIECEIRTKPGIPNTTKYRQKDQYALFVKRNWFLSKHADMDNKRRQ